MMDVSSGRKKSPARTHTTKIAGLLKRAQCLKPFSKPNFRHRVFILTNQSLSYYAGTIDRIGVLKGRIPLESVRAVEFVDETALGLAHTLQVIHSSKKHGFVTLYITARDRCECADWVSSLRQVCYFTDDMLMHYHSGVFTKNRWSCCLNRSKLGLGCQPTFHLLTRSSSRYADMRRRDTLVQRQRAPWKRNHTSTSLRTSQSYRVFHNSTQTQGIRSNSCSDLFSCQAPAQKLTVGPSEPSSVSSYSLTTVSISEPVFKKGLSQLAIQQEASCSQSLGIDEVSEGQDADDELSREIQASITQNSSRDPSPVFEETPIVLTRKPTIQPRISDSNPDMIHV